MKVTYVYVKDTIIHFSTDDGDCWIRLHSTNSVIQSLQNILSQLQSSSGQGITLGQVKGCPALGKDMIPMIENLLR